MAFGPLGAQVFDALDGAVMLPGFVVRAGLEGPQVVVAWNAPTPVPDRVMLRRKVREYPRDPEDGVLVTDLVEGLDTARVVVDRAGLLAADAVPGASRWWYYRAFLVPANLPLADQHSGMGVQVVVQAIPVSVTLDSWDVQAYRSFTVTVQNRDAAPLDFTLQAAPTDGGPWIDLLTAVPVAASTTSAWAYAEQSHKHVQAIVDGRDAVVSISAQRRLPWTASSSAVVLAYRTGYHAETTWDWGHVPEAWRTLDGGQGLAYLTEGVDAVGEAFNLGRQGDPRGPLYRFLAIFVLELDRAKAYLDAAREFDSDIDEMPPDVLRHLAYELGWSVDETKPLGDVRADLFRLAGLWKARGTSLMLDRAVLAEIGVVPRVQEGAGLLFRFADPSLWR